jgi:hypothetical protein
MATLSGYAIPLHGNLPADHTYVESDDGFVWPCWGRSSGGHQLCAGYGSSAVANCISLQNSQAGLLYGLTGVCHQTANRILHPATVVVSEARGYTASAFLYGAYGTDARAWRARLRRCSAIGSGGGVTAYQSNENIEREKYMRRVDRLYADRNVRQVGQTAHAVRADLGAELEMLLDYRLGPELDQRIVSQLVDLQQDALDAKEPLDQALELGHMSGLEYAERVNALAGELTVRAVPVLGPERHRLVFLAPPGAVVVVEPEIAEEVYTRPRNW